MPGIKDLSAGITRASEGEIGRGPTVGRKTGAEAAVSILARGGELGLCVSMQCPQGARSTPKGA